MATKAFPTGWLDIHAHFQLPQSPKEIQNYVEFARKAYFMIDTVAPWNAHEVLAYNDAANITMQMLSCIPADLNQLRQTNDYGARIVQEHPSRFGLLAALPTDDPDACLEEISRTMDFAIPPDGFATTTVRNGTSLADTGLDAVWTELNRRKAVVHIHPSGSALPSVARPTPLVEVAFDTTRTVVEMVYSNIFNRFPDIVFVVAHCGGGVPALSGRLSLLGTQSWVPNQNNVSRRDIEEQLGRLAVDTAATAKTGLAPAVRMCGVERCVYGSDCGVPCSTVDTMEENRIDVVNFERDNDVTANTIGSNGWLLFPAAKKRALAGNGST